MVETTVKSDGNQAVNSIIDVSGRLFSLLIERKRTLHFI
jgi:hypothetical protein